MTAGVAPGRGDQTQAGRYAAFISYSHADEEFAGWLHNRLESYQVPSALVGREGPAGAIKKRLGKVFRDSADLSAAHDLGAEIRAGLEQADALIVLCSPCACGSKYVNEEVRTFKALGKAQRIFAAIVGGEPHAAGNPNYTAAEECFPQALIYQLGANGALSATPEPNEPIAADFRIGRDGRENGSLKLIAGLLEVGLDELVQRERQAERERRRRANMVAAAMVFLVLGVVSAGGFAWLKQNEAVANFNLAQRRDEAEVKARAEAGQYAREREQQQRFANYNAAEALIQELAASQSEATARSSMTRIFAERSWRAKERGEFTLAVRYALAGWRANSDTAEKFGVSFTSEGEYRDALGSVLHYTNVSRLIGHDGGLWGADFSPDGARIVTASNDGTARVWSAASGSELAVLRGHQGAVHSATFNPDGTRIVTASGDRTARVWNADAGRELAVLRGHEGVVHSAAFSPNGAHIVTASNDGTARVWNAGTGREFAVLRGHAGIVHSAAFSPDGARIVTASGDRTARVWNADTGRELAVLRGHEGVMHSAAFSPDGAHIVTASNDGTARVWNADSGREFAVLRGHAGLVHSAAFSPDGARIVTASNDGTARVWDIASSRELATLQWDADAVWGATFSPDGTRIVTASNDSTATVWDVSRLTQPMPELARAACTNFLSPAGRRFSALEIGADPLIREVWLRDHGEDRDVCEGVPGVLPLEPRAQAAQPG